MGSSVLRISVPKKSRVAEHIGGDVNQWAGLVRHRADGVTDDVEDVLHVRRQGHATRFAVVIQLARAGEEVILDRLGLLAGQHHVDDGALADLAEQVRLMGRRVDELYEPYGAMWQAIEQMAATQLRKLKPGEYDVDIGRLQEQVSVLMDRQNEFREQLALLDRRSGGERMRGEEVEEQVPGLLPDHQRSDRAQATR